MISLVREKERALELRKMGWTYSEILKELPVAKSSLSLWLKDLPLAELEREVLKARRRSNVSQGRIKAATSNRANRQSRGVSLAQQAEVEFEKRRWDPLFLVGVALYWTEGSRSKSQVQLVSSDPEIINIFVRWIEKFLNLPREKLSFRGNKVGVPRNPSLLIKMRTWQKLLAAKYN
jgi:hypothetical protein